MLFIIIIEDSVSELSQTAFRELFRSLAVSRARAAAQGDLATVEGSILNINEWAMRDAFTPAGAEAAHR